MDEKELNALIVKSAEEFRIDANLITAMVMVESSNNNWKVRFEPAWHYLYFPREFASKLYLSIETETNLQSCSFGLLQIMGSVARELGFTTDLAMLCDPTTGLFYGVKYIRKLMDKFADEEHVVSAYNAGPGTSKTPGGMWGNQVYVDKVYNQLRKLRQIQ